MSKKWYIVNAQSGCEAIAKASIEERARAMGKQELIAEILIPTENVIELVKGQKTKRSKKFFPGYLFINMEMNEAAWHLVKSASKVSGFIGGAQPQEVSPEEVARVAKQMETGAERVKPKFSYNIGETVVIIDGPFNTFHGSVEEVNEDKGKVRVLVSIFGRPTPVELDFVQVEKA